MVMLTTGAIFGTLLIAHALADYPLQGEVLARAKRRHCVNPILPWYQALAVHAALHGLFVGLLTRSLWFGLAETAVHFGIDYYRCDEKLTRGQDQALHVACKAAWVGLAAL